MKYWCTFCDVFSHDPDDKKFNICYQHKHEIVTLLKEEEHTTSGIATAETAITTAFKGNEKHENILDKTQHQLSQDLQHLNESIEKNFHN